MTVSFSKLTWINGTTAVQASTMQRVEDGLDATVVQLNKLLDGTGGLLAQWYNIRDNAETYPQPCDLLLSEVLTSIDLTNYSPASATSYYGIIQGYVNPGFSELYTFSLTSDDDCRLFVDGIQLIGLEGWGSHGSTTFQGTITLAASKWVPIKILHINRGGSQRLKLEWQSASRSLQTIPSGNLKWSLAQHENVLAHKRGYFDENLFVADQRVWHRGILNAQNSQPTGTFNGQIWINTSETA